MKKLGLISILLSVLLILTSCMKVTMSLEVDKDGNGTMEGSFLFSKKIAQIAEMSGEDTGDFCSQVTEDEMGVAPPEGADEVTLFEDDDWCGYSFIGTFQDFKVPDSEDEGAPSFMVEGDEITFSMEMDIGELGLGGMSEDAESDGIEFQQMMEIFDIPEPEFVVAVTLPGEVTAHNADSLEGSTLTWNIDLLDEQESGSLSATADMSSGSSSSSNTGTIIGIAVGVAVALLVVRQRVSAKKLDVSEEDDPIFE